MKNPPHDRTPSRRELLQRVGLGFGWLALLDLLRQDGLLRAQERQHAPEDGLNLPALGQAQSVIFLFMGGGPSQVDTFDPKPLLEKYHGKPFPAKVEPTQFNAVGNTLAGR